MVNVSYPGVYVTEKRGQPAASTGGSPSTGGILGFTSKGPIDKPTLVASFVEFERLFGSYSSKTLTPTGAYSYFVNGGRRLYVVRTVASDATYGVAYLGDSISDENTGEAGDGVTTVFTLAPVRDPLQPGSVTFHVVAPVSAEDSGEDGDGVETSFSFVLANSPVLPGSVTINAASVAAMTDDGEGNLSGADGTGTINYTNGAVVLSYTTAPAVGDITSDYSYKSISVTDDGQGSFVDAALTSGAVDYLTGEIELDMAAAPAVGELFYLDYGFVSFRFDMKWPGAAGNDFRVALAGAAGFELPATASFSRWQVLIQELDSRGEYQTLRQFDNLVLDDPDDPDFIVTKINDRVAGSDDVVVTAYDNNFAPSQLSGVAVIGESLTPVPAYDGSTTGFVYQLAGGDCAETTLALSLGATPDAVIGDDGNGGLVRTSGTANNLDSSGVNSIDYATGAISIVWTAAPAIAEVTSVDYYRRPEETVIYGVVTGGGDGSAVSRADITSPLLAGQGRGIYSLDEVTDNIHLWVPDFETDATVSGDVLDFCDSRKDRFGIVSVPVGSSPAEAKNYRQNELLRNTTYGALYYPHIQINDPLTQNSILIPPGSHVAGVFSRVDEEQNVSEQPAGMRRAQLRFITGLETDLKRSDVGNFLRPNHINSIVNWEEVGAPTVWGSNLLALGDEFSYIATRRLFMFVQKTLFRQSHPFVFEKNNSAIQSQVRLQTQAFLGTLWRNQYLAGDTPEEGFYVICDATNNPQETVDQGILNVEVGLAVDKPAEFIVFTVSRLIGG